MSSTLERASRPPEGEDDEGRLANVDRVLESGVQLRPRVLSGFQHWAAALRMAWDFDVTQEESDAWMFDALFPAIDAGRGWFTHRVRIKSGVAQFLDPQIGGGAPQICVPAAESIFNDTLEKQAGFLRLGVQAGIASSELGEKEILQWTEEKAGKQDNPGFFALRDGVSEAFVMVALRLPGDPLPQISRRHLQIARHAGAARRLRRLVRERSATEEMIFSADGELLHAAGAGRQKDFRREVAEVIKAGKGAPLSEQSDVLSAVVSGRWSLVDRFDDDGQHLVVAHRNPAGAIDPRRLTAREAEIFVLAQKGNSDEEIAKKIGSSRSTVASQVAHLVAKLGLKSRIELPSFYRQLAGDVVALDQTDDFVCIASSTDSSWLDALTDAERATVDLALSGMSDKEIAAAREVRPRTVANQLRSAFVRLGVSTRIELSALAGARSRR